MLTRTFKIFSPVLLILLLVTQVSGRELKVLVQKNSYPFYFIEDQETASGLIPEILFNMLGDTYTFSYSYEEDIPKSMKPEILCLSEESMLPGGYDWVRFPMGIDYVIFYRKNQPVASLSGSMIKRLLLPRVILLSISYTGTGLHIFLL
jgi:hypothetical protein